MDDMDEIVAEFLVESHENLDQLDRDLVSLESDPTSRELLSSIFRTIHTIKGTSGFLAFGVLERVTHVGENLLSRLRDGALVLTRERTTALLEMVDAVRAILAAIETTGAEGTADHAELVALLEALCVDAPAPPDQPSQPDAGSVAAVHVEHAAHDAAPGSPAAYDAQAAAIPTDVPDDVVTLALHQQLDLGDERPMEMIVQGLTGDLDPDHDLPGQVAVETETRRSIADSSVRVDVDLLDSLMRLVGELVLTRNQVVSFAGRSSNPDLAQATQRLNVISSELQEGVMKTRMQPIDNVWSRLPRIVRDLAQTCGREVQLVLEGRETELDKTILEAVKDPLTHLVRNAVDHGIEPPEVREAAGKPRTGTLRMRAFHESGRVNIEISDDGAGIDPRRIATKAVEKGLLPLAEVQRMNDQQLRELIFLPGFSTAASISNVSGRGVGMDVVKTNIENIGGSVDVVSPPEGGTTFRIAIPLTLAIIPAVTVECGAARYAIPQVSLVELVSVEPGSPSVEDVGGVPVYRLRERLLPLVDLADVLRLERRRDTGAVSTIAVLQADGQQFGLVVDRVLDTEEIVVKPLSDQVKRIAEFAGATILGDGRVALILDTMALARSSGVLGSTAVRQLETAVGPSGATDESHLVLELDDGRRVAVPTSDVTRLEQFPAHLVERTGTREVIQYRGAILPLVRLSAHLGAYGDVAADGPVRVVVCTSGSRSVGLVVASIVDITHGDLTAVSDLDGLGVTGSAVIQDRVTEILDVRAAILDADPRFFDTDIDATVPADVAHLAGATS